MINVIIIIIIKETRNDVSKNFRLLINIFFPMILFHFFFFLRLHFQQCKSSTLNGIASSGVKMENLSLGGVDFNESMFNSQFEQQHTNSHFKHQNFMSNLFKRNIDSRTTKDTDCKDADIKPYNYLSHIGTDITKENISHSDDIEHNDISAQDNDNIGFDSMKSRNHIIGENLSMNGKKTNDDCHYSRISQ